MAVIYNIKILFAYKILIIELLINAYIEAIINVS